MKTNNNSIVRCAIYTRKSVEEGLEQEFNSLDAQREAAEAYIASQRANNWVCLPERYDDGGYSGGNTDRPALQRLLKDCGDGKVDVVVTYKVDRLSRSLCDFTDLSKQFNRWNVSFVSVTQQIDTSTSAGKMMLNLLMTFAEYEREIISERIRDKVAASKKKGIWMGGTVPLGYKVADRKLVIVPEDAAIIQKIFADYMTTHSPMAVAAGLNSAGIVKKSGKEWTQQNVLSILRNPVYIGMVKHKDKIYNGEHDAIVGNATWDMTQKLIAPGERAVERGRPPNFNAPLRKRLYCGYCGGLMTPYTAKRGSKTYAYYRCSKDIKRGTHTCPLRQVPSKTVDDLVLEYLGAVFRTPEVASELSIMTAVPVKPVIDILCGQVYKSMTEHAKTEIISNLLERAVLYMDHLDIEIKTGGMECIMEQIENESSED